MARKKKIKGGFPVLKRHQAEAGVKKLSFTVEERRLE